jgi:hypothetical protein
MYSTAKASNAVYYKGKARNNFLPENYLIDEELSNKKILTIYDPVEKKLITSHRGTQGKGDIRQDIVMGLGLNRYNKNYKEGYEISKKAKDKYTGYDYTLTGQSLGGKNAYDIGSKLGVKTVTYDTPASVWDINKFNLIHNNLKPNKKNELHTVVGDPVSIGSYFTSGNKKIIMPTTGSVHSVENYLDHFS